MGFTSTRSAAAVIAMVILAGCQSLIVEEEPNPTGPSEVTEQSAINIPVIGISSTTPSPTPSPEAPEPTPSPEPTPTPEPPPTTRSCRLPASNPSHRSCTDASPRLESEVEAALDAVTERFPELFDFNNTRCANCYYVKDPRRYIDEVINQLESQGLCTDGVYEELGIKSSNDFSEQYDIILSSDHMRRAPSAYRGVCRPAIF